MLHLVLCSILLYQTLPWNSPLVLYLASRSMGMPIAISPSAVAIAIAGPALIPIHGGPVL